MVKKLFKHEFLAYIRVLFFVYLILLTIAGAGRIIQCFEDDTTPYKIVSAMSFLTYGASVVGTFVFTFVFALLRFYRNLFTAEGYLSFTLPVTPAQHILVKAVTAVTMEIIAILMILLSGCVITAGDVLVEIWKAVIYILGKIHAEIGFQDVLIGVELILLGILSLFADIMLYYTFISIGQLFKKNRILAAFGAYFVWYLLTQAASSALSVALSLFAATDAFGDFLVWLIKSFIDHPYVVVHSGLWLAILWPILVSLVEFLVIRKIITKKLNLE